MNLEIEQILTQIVAFLIMLWVLKKFAWRPLLGLMEERKQLIQSEFDSIEEQKKEVGRLTGEYNAKLHDIEAESRRKIQEAVDKGRNIAHDIERETRQRAAMILNKAHAEVERELAEAKDQLKNEMVRISLAATEKLIQEKLDASKHKQLIEDAIKQAEL